MEIMIVGLWVLDLLLRKVFRRYCWGFNLIRFRKVFDEGFLVRVGLLV